MSEEPEDARPSEKASSHLALRRLRWVVIFGVVLFAALLGAAVGVSVLRASHTSPPTVPAASAISPVTPARPATPAPPVPAAVNTAPVPQLPAVVPSRPEPLVFACALDAAAVPADVMPCAQSAPATRCQREGDFKSTGSREPVTMLIVNLTHEPLSVYWLDFSGSRRLYEIVAPGKNVSQSTFWGHHWLVTARDGHCVGIFTASSTNLMFQ